MKVIAYRRKRQPVVHGVLDDGPFPIIVKPVGVTPEPIGASYLLVHEPDRWLPIRDPRLPCACCMDPFTTPTSSSLRELQVRPPRRGVERNRFAEVRVPLGMRGKLCRLQTQLCSTGNETTRSRRNSEGRSYDRQTGPAGHPARVSRGMGGLARRTPCHLGWAVDEVRKKELGHPECFPCGGSPPRPLLRLDRRPGSQVRRAILAAAIHSTQAEEQMVEDQPRQSQATHRAG